VALIRRSAAVDVAAFQAAEIFGRHDPGAALRCAPGYLMYEPCGLGGGELSK